MLNFASAHSASGVDVIGRIAAIMDPAAWLFEKVPAIVNVTLSGASAVGGGIFLRFLPSRTLHIGPRP